MGPAPAATGSVAAARSAWIAVAAAAAVSLVGRVLLARTVVSPFIYQDEGGYVGVARLLVGDAPTLYGPTYLPGYGLLLAPAAAVFGPAGLQNAAQVLNALAAAAVIPALHLVGRRVGNVRPWVSAAAAVSGGTMAASIVQATMLLPEALLVLVVVLCVLALHEALRAGTPGWAAVAGAVVGLAYAIHPRSAVALVALVVVAAVAVWQKLVTRRVAAVLVGAAVGVAGAAQVLHLWATEQLYPAGTRPSLAGSPLGALGEPIGATVIAVGQSWYVLVATLGVAPIGFLAAARLGWIERGQARGLAAGFVALGALGSLALGTIGSYDVGTGTDVTRADLPVYGRYLEQWVPVLVVLAPALVRSWGRAALAVVAAAAASIGLALHAVYPTDTWDLPVAWHNVASLRVPVELFGADHLVQTGLAVGVAAFLLGGPVARGRHRWWWGLPLLVVVVVNVTGGVLVVRDWAGPASQAWAERHELGPLLVDADEPVWVDRGDDFDVFWAYNVQYWHPEVDVEWFAGEPPSDVRFVVGDADRPPVPDAVLVGVEPHGDVGLWSPPQQSSS